jgi:hypothetical protein
MSSAPAATVILLPGATPAPRRTDARAEYLRLRAKLSKGGTMSYEDSIEKAGSLCRRSAMAWRTWFNARLKAPIRLTLNGLAP